MTRIDWNIQVYCKHCGEAQYKIDCKTIDNYTFRCPDCNRICRNQPSPTKVRRYQKYIYVKQYGKPHQYVKEIRELGKAEARVV